MRGWSRNKWYVREVRLLGESEAKRCRVKKSYAEFRYEVFARYRVERPNSSLPSEVVLGVMYDAYVAGAQKK
jgi:hypothetical protein